MFQVIKKKKNIRRFTDDVLSREMRESIKKMARTISQDVSRKVLTQKK